MRRWKSAVPELGGLFGGASKRRLWDRSRAGLDRLVVETRRAELVHWLAPAPLVGHAGVEPCLGDVGDGGLRRGRQRALHRHPAVQQGSTPIRSGAGRDACRERRGESDDRGSYLYGVERAGGRLGPPSRDAPARGWRWHRSHHVRWHTRWEDNDRFPLLFAGLTIMTMAYASARGRHRLLGGGAGVAVYGALYVLVHDVAVHGRLTNGRPVLRGRWLRWVAVSHGVHHRTGAAPYGFLLPIEPARYQAAVTSLRTVGTRALVAKTS